MYSVITYQCDLTKTRGCYTLFYSSPAELKEIAYGIKKLQIICVVEDDKVGTDDLEEQICGLEDLVSDARLVNGCCTHLYVYTFNICVCIPLIFVCVYLCVLMLYSGTSHCGHLSNMDTCFCPNCGNPDLKTPLQSGQLRVDG